MKKTFSDFADTSIQANYLFAGLDCLATAVINICIVAIYYLGGNAVGAGSGKSTVTKLLLRYHDVTNGRITLQGQDIRSISQTALRSNISYVPQKAWLFSGTVAENLRYGNQNASEEELCHALHVAQSDFVLDLPKGLEAAVAQGGSNFSGGQKQRLAIARVFLCDPEILIFD